MSHKFTIRKMTVCCWNCFHCNSCSCGFLDLQWQWFHFVCSGEFPDIVAQGGIPCQFKVGDKVRVDLEADILKCMQEGHGGWNPRMAEVSQKWFVYSNYYYKCYWQKNCLSHILNIDGFHFSTSEKLEQSTGSQREGMSGSSMRAVPTGGLSILGPSQRYIMQTVSEF